MHAILSAKVEKGISDILYYTVGKKSLGTTMTLNFIGFTWSVGIMFQCILHSHSPATPVHSLRAF